MNTIATRLTETLAFKRATPGTYLYENTNKESPITTLYIKKAAFAGEAPKNITLTVTAE